MVTTRSTSSGTVPRLSPPPPSPTKRRARTPAATPAPPELSSITVSVPSVSVTPAVARAAFTHTPSTVALAWLAVSLPLVAWDTSYVLLRPHSMPGGAWHLPWKPYELYGRVDHVYGFKRWDAGDGFCAAQGTLNLLETLLYGWYLYLYNAHKEPAPRGVQDGGRGAVRGRPAAVATVVLFAALVMTLSKTVLYWLNEYWSGFDNIGHNSGRDVFFLWVCPNGLWLVFPAYLIYIHGREIIDALAGAPERTAVKAE